MTGEDIYWSTLLGLAELMRFGDGIRLGYVLPWGGYGPSGFGIRHEVLHQRHRFVL